MTSKAIGKRVTRKRGKTVRKPSEDRRDIRRLRSLEKRYPGSIEPMEAYPENDPKYRKKL